VTKATRKEEGPDEKKFGKMLGLKRGRTLGNEAKKTERGGSMEGIWQSEKEVGWKEKIKEGGIIYSYEAKVPCRRCDKEGDRGGGEVDVQSRVLKKTSSTN